MVEMLTVGREGGRRKERGGEGPHTAHGPRRPVPPATPKKDPISLARISWQRNQKFSLTQLLGKAHKFLL